MKTNFVKKPCADCPYRSDVKPYLTVERAMGLAFSTRHEHSKFFCHKTLEQDEDDGDPVVGKKSKQCAGFLTMKARECDEKAVPETFKPSFDKVYDSMGMMIMAYQNEESKV